MADRQAGARWVEVPPERLVRWVENFTHRHGPAVAEPGREVVVLRARDGAAAACHPPFPPLPQPRAEPPRGSPLICKPWSFANWQSHTRSHPKRPRASGPRTGPSQLSRMAENS